MLPCDEIKTNAQQIGLFRHISVEIEDKRLMPPKHQTERETIKESEPRTHARSRKGEI